MIILEWEIEFWPYGKVKDIIISLPAAIHKVRLMQFIILTLVILKVYGLMFIIPIQRDGEKRLLYCIILDLMKY